MNSRWAAIVAASLVAFASLVITWQFRHCDGGENVPHGMYSSLVMAFHRGEQLGKISDISERDSQITSASGSARYIDLVLPTDARIFMTDMIGPTNYSRITYYYFMTYYLFPREVETSLDHITRLTQDGFLGKTSESDQEILSNGFDVRIDITPDRHRTSRGLRNLSIRDPVNPDWFDSYFDLVIAFLLPFLTALTGMWLFRLLFPSLGLQMPLLEQLAYGLGLGMMAVAALTLGVKLCCFSGRGLILSVTAVGGIVEMWCNRKAYLTGIIDGYWRIIRRPVAIALFVAGLLVFLILFRLAGLQGIVDYDSVMAWLLKAKIIHLYTGSEMVQWFSNPRLAHAHLDYPTLVPSLHAATYDSLGHVDEFVTKFWPTWMLLFLMGALASLNRAGKSRFHAPHFALLGLLLLPATQKYVQYEGGTLPMIFFTVLGFVQCALWLVGKDPARLGLGLTLLFGAAMSKFEGFVFLALLGGWLLLLPSARPPWKLLPRFWRTVAFCLLAALPFVCLRRQIPILNYESNWAGHVLNHSASLLSTLSNWLRLFKVELARLFVNPDFANWNGEGGQLHWIGKWGGLSSLYNPSTLGLAWLCLLLTVALWFAIPTRRQIVVWILAMFLGAVAALSGVFACFVNISSLDAVINFFITDVTGGRYLLPMLLAWFATTLAMLFLDQPSTESTLAPNASNRNLPVLKDGYWLVIGALLILALGIFVLPKNKSSLPENPLQNAAATNSLDNSKTNSPGNPELQKRMEFAIQLNKAGKFAEAIQEDRETAQLYPNDPMALNNLAWDLAANPRLELRNGKEAVQLASKAVELTDQQNALFIETLAAAYAEDGQFAKAVEMAKKARDVALLNQHPEIAAVCKQLLKLYSAGQAVGLTNGP